MHGFINRTNHLLSHQETSKLRYVSRKYSIFKSYIYVSVDNDTVNNFEENLVANSHILEIIMK